MKNRIYRYLVGLVKIATEKAEDRIKTIEVLKGTPRGHQMTIVCVTVPATGRCESDVGAVR